MDPLDGNVPAGSNEDHAVVQEGCEEPDELGQYASLADDDDKSIGEEEEEGGNSEGEEEDQEGGVAVDAASLPSVMEQNDPRRMKLTLEEMEIALSIEETLSASSDIDHIDVSDYTIAQLAIICGRTETPEDDALQRLLGLQAFKEEYDIHDTLEEGNRAIEEYFQVIPTYIIHFGFKEDEGTYFQVIDHQGFDSKALKSEANFRKFMRGMYYEFLASSCDLHTIRVGYVCIVDCSGISWSMKDDFKILKHFLDQLWSVYPIQPKAWRHYHKGVIVNLILGMATRVLPKKTREMFLQPGLNVEGRLRDTFLLPTEEAATQRTVKQYQDALKRRFDNENNFALS